MNANDVRNTVLRSGTLRLAAAVLMLAAAGCAGDGVTGPPPSQGGPTASQSAPSHGSGLVAKSASSAFAIEARDVRLVRVGRDDVALQFELFNGTSQPIEPYDIGLDPTKRDLKLVDLPRATAYDVQDADGIDGRITELDKEIAPGSSATLTAVFTAPPQETTKLWMLSNVTAPVEVPIQPAGSAALTDDAVLTGARGADPYVYPAVCAKTGPQGEDQEGPVEIRLPSDVLFEFGKSDLTPSAQAAIDSAVEGQIKATEGTITIEGHTDAIGDDPSNQALSEARAASVKAALEAKLGSGFTYHTTGFGESRPVAPNSNPDGSDNPDGRAQNRRVEIRTGNTTGAVPVKLEPRDVTNELAAKGLTATVDEVRRVDGYLLTTVTITNPTSSAVEIGNTTGLTTDEQFPGSYRPIGITLADQISQRRLHVCYNHTLPIPGFGPHNGPPATHLEPQGTESLPAGASVQLWGFYTAPPTEVTSVDVELGGFGGVASAQISA
ncbi:MAG TPA: OmpA family protein [Mycobacterium sp.]|nr:OmpA family protein [Mycobacterium sp.]